MNEEPREFPCPGPITVLVRVGGGQVSVIAEERDTASVTVEPYDGSEASFTAAENTTVDMRGEQLRIEAPENTGGFLLRRGARVRIDVRVPLDTALQVKSGSADVEADGRLRDVSVNTGSGDIRVAETSGDLTVNTGSGDVNAGLVGGVLRLTGASGDLDVKRVHGEVVANMASGDVEIEDAAGPVRVTTASGDVNLGATRTGHVRVNSASGDVSVGVVAGTRVWLDLSTVSGSTSSDLEMSQQGGLQIESSPALNLQVRTMSGDIQIRRVPV